MTTSVSTVQNSSSTTASSTGSSSSSSSTSSTSFYTMLTGLLNSDSQGKINEEQLYSALINQRLYSKKGASASTAYQKLFEVNKTSLKTSEGYIPVEQAASTSLKQMVQKGLLSQNEATSINAQAFKAAQLDNNANYVYDSIGSTVAVALIDNAIKSAEEKIQGFDNGTVSAGILNLDNIVASSTSGSTSSGSSSTTIREFNGDHGFLYKPESEGDHNLAVLLPVAMTDDVTSVKLISNSGEVLESSSIQGKHDGRGVFRFDHPGSYYPDNLTISVTLKDGTTKEYYIPDSSERWE